jgi:hypothetical protein
MAALVALCSGVLQAKPMTEKPTDLTSSLLDSLVFPKPVIFAPTIAE